MISSLVKRFLIQLTLTFVVFFDNTLATSHEDWCENEINNIDIPLRDNARVLCKYFLESFLTANEEKQKSFWEDKETIKNCLETSLQKAIENLTDAILNYNAASKGYDKGYFSEYFKNVYHKAYRAASLNNEYNLVEKIALNAAKQYVGKQVHASVDFDAYDMAYDAVRAANDAVDFDAKAGYDAAKAGYDAAQAAYVAADDTIKAAYDKASHAGYDIDLDFYNLIKAAYDKVFDAVYDAERSKSNQEARDAVRAATNAAQAAANAVQYIAKAAYDAAYIAATKQFGLVCIVKYTEFK